MNTILISYDLRSPGKDYSRLWDRLKSYGNWAKPLESFWLIRTTHSAEQVRDDIINYTDKNDKLFIVDVTRKSCAWENLANEVIQWIGPSL